MKSLTLRNIILILSFCVLGVACSDSSSTGTNNSESAIFKGRVENTSAQSNAKANSSANTFSSVEAAVVTAARINAKGELETIGNSQAQTDANGKYSLNVDVSAAAGTSDNIVIVASKSGESAKAFVGSNVENGATVTVQPINIKSTARAEVYQQVVADGNDDMVTQADVEANVQTEVAADIESDSAHAADVAAGLAQSAQAKAAFYAKEGVEVSSQEKDDILQAKEDAQAQLANQLDAATSTEDEQTAYNVFLQAMANAEIDAGVDTSSVAESNDFAARVLINKSSSLSTNAQSEIRSSAYYYTAVAIDAATQAELKAVGASDATVSAAADAGATLRTGLKDDKTITKNDIKSLFVSYNEEIQTAVNDDSSLNSSAFVTTNTQISGSAGLKTTFESALNASTDISVMNDAYSSFSSSIKTLATTNFTGVDDATVQAYSRLLVLINLAS